MATKELNVGLNLDTSDYEKGLRRSGEATKKFAASVLAVESLGNMFGKAVGAVKDLAQEIAAIANKAESLSNLSAKTGMATDSLQQLQRMADNAGVAFESITSATRFMQRNIESGSKAFKALGLDLKELKNHSPEQQLQRVAQAINDLKSPADRTAAAMAIFGRGGTELLPIMDKLAKGAKDYATVLSEDQLKALREIDDQLDLARGAWADLKEQFVASIATSPLLVETLTTVAEALRGLSSDRDLFESFWDTMAKAIQNNVNWLTVISGAYDGFRRRLASGDKGEFGVEWGIENALKQIEALNAAMDKARDKQRKERDASDLRKKWGLSSPTVSVGGREFDLGKEKEAARATRELNKALDEMDKQLAAVNARAEELGQKDAWEELDALDKALTDFQKSAETIGLAKLDADLDAAEKAFDALTRAVEESKLSIDERAFSGALSESDAMIEEMAALKVKTTGVKDETVLWQGALEGVALLAGSIGGAFGDVLNVIGNIGDAFSRIDWDEASPLQKFNVIAGGIGQIGGLIGQKNRKTGGFLQGAAGGAMTGAAMGSVLPGIGTVAGGVIGGIVGGIGGLFGGRKKEKEEKAAKLAAEKEQYEGLIKALERQYGSIMKARNAARLYGIDLKAAMDPKNPKALEAALADLEKRQAGMQTAMAGAAGLASWKSSSEEGAKAQGALFGSVFWAAVKTEGLTKAAAALGEPFEEMWKNASASMQTLLAPIRQQLDLAKNESFAAAAEGANALSQLLAGLSDAGVVSIQDLANASTVAQEQYNQALAAAQEQGLTGAAAQEAAIRAVGPAIAELISLHEQLGIPLDENLQKLKDTAEESGVMFPEDAMTRAAESMERVAAALEKAFGFSTGLAANVDRIGRGRAPDYGDGGGNGGGDNYPEYASGTGGPVRVKRDMIARIHAGEGLLVVPKNEMPAGGRLGWGSFERGIRDEAEEPIYRGTVEERRAASVAATGGVSAESASASSVESPTMQVVEALEEVRAALIELAAVQPITIQNAPVIELVDQSAVKTAEGQRAFGQFVTQEVERALDQNSRGLTTKIEQIARRAVSK